MSKLNGRKAKQVQLHAPLFIQGFGQIGPTVSTSGDGMVSAARAQNLTMEISDGYLVLMFIGKNSKTGNMEPFEVAIPAGANIISMQLEPISNVVALKK